MLPVADRDADTSDVAAATGDIAEGEYAVVLTLDGADSPLDRAADGAIEAPLVTLP